MVQKKWEKPPIVKVKVNFDAAISKDKIGFGVLARDDEGFVVGRSYGFRVEKTQVEWVELQAFEESIKVASFMHTTNIIFETDCTSFANRIRNRGVDITIIGQRINELYKSKNILKKAEFMWVNRNCNKAMNFLSKFDITNNCNLNFGMDYPLTVHDFVIVVAIN
ncbi:hypothetical protein Gogos_012533 [Gossypium gossypioides]|uniref:RNase H type-1 domain-containing protein n=1 Tax=Gossypium gossypioides TaxID=34282 RepID=A0A7J9BT59_GOSGO|nr:hypothetical protein [Gossypium gossypioides]